LISDLSLPLVGRVARRVGRGFLLQKNVPSPTLPTRGRELSEPAATDLILFIADED